MTIPARVSFANDRSVPCRRPANNPDWWGADKEEGGSHYTDAVAAAKLACLQCRRRVDCLIAAADTDDEHGIRGGLTPTERAAWTVDDGDPFDLRDFPEAPQWYAKPFSWQGSGRRYNLRDLFAAVDAVRGGVGHRDAAEEFGASLTNLQQAVLIRRWAPDLVDDVCDGHVPIGAAERYARAVRDFFTPGRPATAAVSIKEAA
jgi:hypothetical protein